MSVELFAVNAVSDRIATCPRLTPEITIGDRTPITDGHIDFYHSDKKKKETHGGRVPIQVKGRVTNAKIKASRTTQSFQVEREVLQFFRNHGGGIYFYVSMREGGEQREVFYASLFPFRVDRLLDGRPETQKKFSVKLKRLPDDPSEIEGIVRLAWHARAQSSTASKNDHLLGQAESLTIHSLTGFSKERPTRLSLAETDYVVVAHLPGNLHIPIDVDLDVLPHQYVERDLAVPISCGGVEFANATGRRTQEDTLLIHLSEGLELTVKIADQTLNTNLDLKRKGSFQEQAKNFDFVIAAASGSPLLIGDQVNEPNAGDPGLAAELRDIRQELSRLIELCGELGIDDDLSSRLQLDGKMRQTLIALHEGLVNDRPVRSTSDGTGRYDVPIGEYKITVIVMPAEDEGFRRLVDPFDPTKRSRFRIYRIDERGAPESIDWGTVYESVTAEDMASVINLRLNNVVAAYEALDDRAVATTKANYMVLRLLTSFDLATDESHRIKLLRGAADLCRWLLEEEPDSLVHRINWWQILHRQGDLNDTDRQDIRAARRSLNREEELSGLLEACMLILLGDAEELQLAMSELSEADLEKLRSWPVWTLTKNPADLGMPRVED